MPARALFFLGDLIQLDFELLLHRLRRAHWIGGAGIGFRYGAPSSRLIWDFICDFSVSQPELAFFNLSSAAS
jgi:hypothetical protein